MATTAMRDRARDLRKRSTDPESRLWRELRGRRFAGFKFRRQLPLGDSIVDFCCLERRLTIELDGGQHANPGEAERDTERTRALGRMGFIELRFWNTEVVENLAGVLEEIERALMARSHPHPPRSARRPLPSRERRETPARSGD